MDLFEKQYFIQFILIFVLPLYKTINYLPTQQQHFLSLNLQIIFKASTYIYLKESQVPFQFSSQCLVNIKQKGMGQVKVSNRFRCSYIAYDMSIFFVCVLLLGDVFLLWSDH